MFGPTRLRAGTVYLMLWTLSAMGHYQIATTTASVVVYFEKQKSRTADSSVQIPKMETFGSVRDKLWSSIADLSFFSQCIF